MLQKLRIRIIKGLIDFNERIFFERRLRNFYKKNFSSQINTVIDVGANKGQSISFFLQLSPACKIFSFEPNVSLFKSLVLKYENQQTVKLYNIGVSDRTGQKLFQENVLDYTSTFEEVDLDSKYLKNKSAILGVKPEYLIKDKYIVNTIALSEFINSEVNDSIDIIKIDIEGHEYAALQGLFSFNIRHSIKYIQIENHTDDMYLNKIPFEKIEKLLLDNGFKKIATIKHGFGKINEVIFGNILVRHNM